MTLLELMFPDGQIDPARAEAGARVLVVWAEAGGQLSVGKSCSAVIPLIVREVIAPGSVLNEEIIASVAEEALWDPDYCYCRDC